MTEDMKALWQQQPSEEGEMDLDQLRTLVQAQLARTRRTRAVLALVGLAGAGLFGYLAYLAPTGLMRLGGGLTTAGYLLFVVLGWRRIALPSPDTAETSVTFLRESLALRRDSVLRGWIVMAVPLLPGLSVTFAALWIAAGQGWPQKLWPIAALLVLWLIVFLINQARGAAKVNAEIAHLDRQCGA